MKKTYPKYDKGELEKIYETFSKEEKKLTEEFILKCGITAKTKEKLNKIKRIIIQFRDVTELSLKNQTTESVNTFLFILNASNRSVWTKNEIKVYLKRFLKGLYKDLEMIENIKTDNKRGLNPQKITENNLINEKDIEKMIRFARGFKEKAYVLLSFNTGARPIELINLKFKDIKFEENHADVNLFSPKTQRSRTFPVVRETMKALWELKEHYPFPNVSNQDYVFPSRWRDRPLTTNGINKMLRRMALSSEINKDVWGYLLRHSKATKLYEELPTPIVEKLMGHQDQYRTYAHISSKKAKEELLDKIYKIKEMPQEKENELKERIKKLERALEITQEKIEYVLGVENLLKEVENERKKSKEEVKRLSN